MGFRIGFQEIDLSKGLSIRGTFDGSCWPNPHGQANFGFVVFMDGARIHDGHGPVGNGYGMTNNVAEAAALCALLDYLIAEKFNRDADVLIQGDSSVVLNVAIGKRKSPKGFFVKQALEAREKLLKLKEWNMVRLAWIPREMNKEADEMSQISYGQ